MPSLISSGRTARCAWALRAATAFTGNSNSPFASRAVLAVRPPHQAGLA